MPSVTFPMSLQPQHAFGSGYFGNWIDDAFGLPAFHYTCNQTKDPKATTSVDPVWHGPTDHTHQIGNDRLVAAVSNYGYLQVRQDEGSPKFLNDYAPQLALYGAGLGYLADENEVLGTYYAGNNERFDRTFGMGYFRKRVHSDRYDLEQILFAPFGDDPVLISQVKITNRGKAKRKPQWVEYWGCQNYQFSYRSLMEAALTGDANKTPQMRREFATRFTHHFELAPGNRGLVASQSFRGRSSNEEASWQKTMSALQTNPHGFYGGPVPPLALGASMEDLAPPSTFLVSLDGPIDRYATNGAAFFQGGAECPGGRSAHLNNDLTSSGPESAMLVGRSIELAPGESKTLYFLYGYLPQGFDGDGLIQKYSAQPASLLPDTMRRWKSSAIKLSTDSEPWVERETVWSSYYLRSGLTYDSFFREHILSQGGGYQYVAGLQGAARDPLQHALPLVFSHPQIVREIIRYTLKQTQPDGSLPYALVGSGVPMPSRYRPSDLELWLLWLTSEYLLGTRDRQFLEERVPVYPARENSVGDLTIREHLQRACMRIKNDIGVGQHGLMRVFRGDWNDSIVVNRLETAQVAEVEKNGESVLNAAMSAYVLDYYATMLDFVGERSGAKEARAQASSQRNAVKKQWTGRWFRRAWLGTELGWSGEKQLWLEPQPWAILGNCTDSAQKHELIAAVDEFSRKPSPIGALLQSQPDPTMKDQPGVGTNGGVFTAINGTLVWALATTDGRMAWDEWQKNSLARHAEVYPELWFGVWSGPDNYSSVLSKHPGATEPDYFPVMIMHAHAWPLYSAAKMLGLEFHERGLKLRPAFPHAEYSFESPLLGFTKSAKGFEGWYAPAAAGRWEVSIALASYDIPKRRQLSVNGTPVAVEFADGALHFSGESMPGSPLRWELR